MIALIATIDGEAIASLDEEQLERLTYVVEDALIDELGDEMEIETANVRIRVQQLSVRAAEAAVDAAIGVLSDD